MRTANLGWQVRNRVPISKHNRTEERYDGLTRQESHVLPFAVTQQLKRSRLCLLD
jgi:hypothetical protein